MGFYNIVNAPSLVAGQPEDVGQVLANFQAIQAILNGGIDDVNIRSTAAINPSKLLGYPSDPTKVLFGDGIWGGIAPTRQIFTASGPYVAPARCLAIFAACTAGGGAGGGTGATAAGQSAAGGGGGGGAFAASLLVVSALIGALGVVVGVGGVGVVGGTGGNGGLSSFSDGSGVKVSANGGGGGGPNAGVVPPIVGAPGGLGGNGITGDFQIQGADGGAGSNFGAGGGNQTSGQGGAGGGPYGGGASRSAGPGGGLTTAGYLFGGAGSGNCAPQSVAARAGANGANGVVIIWEFY
jgi:hypothetical protein